jgi:uncharacterized protein (DUF58 family)
MADAGNRLRLRHEAERTAAGLPPLLVAAQNVAATVAQGVHGRRRAGQGETFWQFRRYQSGDSLRAIDWRQSAKSDHLFIRETEWAAAQTVWLWRDGSESMRYRSSRRLPEKRDRADLLLLALAALLVRAGERIALLDGGSRPATGSVALDRATLSLLTRNGAPDRASLPPFRPLARFSHVILFGDFLAPLEETDALLRRFAARGVHGHLVQILDPAEVDLPFQGRTRFEGMEDDGRILIKRVENVRDDYKARLADHQAGLSDLARAVGWSYAVHHTDLPPERTLLALYMTLTQTAER